MQKYSEKEIDIALKRVGLKKKPDSLYKSRNIQIRDIKRS